MVVTKCRAPMHAQVHWRQRHPTDSYMTSIGHGLKSTQSNWKIYQKRRRHVDCWPSKTCISISISFLWSYWALLSWHDIIEKKRTSHPTQKRWVLLKKFASSDTKKIPEAGGPERKLTLQSLNWRENDRRRFWMLLRRNIDFVYVSFQPQLLDVASNYENIIIDCIMLLSLINIYCASGISVKMSWQIGKL